jgi:ABC-type transport system involved in multi-copper enzyme maturation permease subunit
MSSSDHDAAVLPGLGFVGTGFESARQTLVLLLRNRLLWYVLLAEGLLALAEFAIGGMDRNRLGARELLCLFSWWFLAGVVLPWTTLYLAVQAVHGEIEDRTFQYLFLRPVRRAPLLLGKWIAVVLVAGFVAVSGGLALFLALAARPSLWENGVELRYAIAFAQVLAFGAVAYAAVGAWFAAALRRPLVWAAVAVILQMVVALLPVSAGIRMLTVSDPLRRLLLDRIEPNAHLAEMLWPGERDFRSELVGQPLLSLAVLTTVVLVLGMISYSRNEYDSRTRE